MRSFCVLLVLCFVNVFNAQQFHPTISNYLNNPDNNFKTADIKDIEVTGQSYSKSLKLYTVYAQQKHQQIPILNAIGSFAIKNNKVINLNHAFVSDISLKIKSSTAKISPKAALSLLFKLLNINIPFELNQVLSDNHFVFSSNETAEDIPVKLMYLSTDQNSLKLVWDISILTPDGSHWWSVSVDANTGEILRQNDWMLHCKFTTDFNIKSDYEKIDFAKDARKTLSLTTDNSKYLAYPLGVESPNHGSRVLLKQPADVVASPFGWHDTNAIEGPEFTITRGNNVFAFEDRDADNVPGYSPDGGGNLNFDFSIDENLPPSFNEDAAITNLFVWNNFIHDIWFNKGFDEASGNFQETNYSNTGLDRDYVLAEAQDGSGLNNANFATPPDGTKPRMQMFLWSTSDPKNLLTLNTPEDLAGEYLGREAGFGPGLSSNPITSDLVLVQDSNTDSESTDPNDACDSILNQQDIDGKIVVINRGLCLFTEKIKAVQNHGAVAVIMVNNVPGEAIIMSGEGSDISIPSIMITLNDGAPIINKLQNNELINATLFNKGPFNIDGDFDNSVIAHEYAHGISNRLTGGSLQANCLINDEQMGEGWSDWIGLMMTMQSEDTPEKPRGYATFAANQPTDGNGIRPTRYSTDMTINPATFEMTNDANVFVPHGIGYIWASMLWDLTWELISQYGFDPDLVNGNGGNNIAMQLVIDGMKLQSCNPGFVDGRDAILQADMLANDGINQCIIWKAFAKRGLGYSAEQGSTSNRFDQVEAFDLPPENILSCENLSINDFNENNFIIYPNPANDFIHIKTSAGNVGKAYLKIFALNGQKLFDQEFDFNQIQQVDISSLHKGVYVLKIINNQINISTKLIIE